MDDSAQAGPTVSTKVYTRFGLSHIYDAYVLGFSMKRIWKCPTESVLLPFFCDNFSLRHLDCGVATGYFPVVALERTSGNHEEQSLSLLDLNPNPLVAAKDRILSIAPNVTVDCVEADVAAPLPKQLQGVEFDSISMFNLFHCIPGQGKFKAFANFKELLSENGVLTGCSVLGAKHATSWVTKIYLRMFNFLGIFNNWDDDEAAFQKALDQEFAEVETQIVGMMLIFEARKPRK